MLAVEAPALAAMALALASVWSAGLLWFAVTFRPGQSPERDRLAVQWRTQQEQRPIVFLWLPGTGAVWLAVDTALGVGRALAAGRWLAAGLGLTLAATTISGLVVVLKIRSWPDPQTHRHMSST